MQKAAHAVYRFPLRYLAAAAALFMCFGTADAAPFSAQRGEPGQGLIQKGLGISPVPVDLTGKNPASVAQGSYIVNTSGCTDCHTFPTYAPGGDPFQGEPEQMNVAGFLAGGAAFGPFISRNITPDRNGLPGGLTYNEFVVSMRTGLDMKNLDPPGTTLLQVMPWPVVAKHTNSNLRAIYDYLSAIPCIEGGPGLPTPPATRC